MHYKKSNKNPVQIIASKIAMQKKKDRWTGNDAKRKDQTAQNSKNAEIAYIC